MISVLELCYDFPNYFMPREIFDITAVKKNVILKKTTDWIIFSLQYNLSGSIEKRIGSNVYILIILYIFLVIASHLWNNMTEWNNSPTG